MSPNFGRFQYDFPTLPLTPQDWVQIAALDGLAKCMSEDANSVMFAPQLVSDNRAAFGQFLRNDLCAGVSFGEIGSRIGDPDPLPGLRQGIHAVASNLRAGRLNLQSVYGNPALARHARHAADRFFLSRLPELLRDPDRPSRMLLPASGRDLPRLGQVLDRENSWFTSEFLGKLSAPLRASLRAADGAPYMQRAMIGDGRNDATPQLRALHLSVLKLHNHFADRAEDHLGAASPEAQFAWAQTQVRAYMRRLVIHSWLPLVCDDETDLTIQSLEWDGGDLPTVDLSMEFICSVLVFPASAEQQGRGLTAVRHCEDADALPWHSAWEDAVASAQPARGGRQDPRTVLAKQDNFAAAGQDQELRQSRLTDILRKGHVLNIPYAQDILATLACQENRPLPALSQEELMPPRYRPYFDLADMGSATPLWYYIQRESLVKHQGQRFGPLGSLLLLRGLRRVLDDTPPMPEPASLPELCEIDMLLNLPRVA